MRFWLFLAFRKVSNRSLQESESKASSDFKRAPQECNQLDNFLSKRSVLKQFHTVAQVDDFRHFGLSPQPVEVNFSVFSAQLRKSNGLLQHMV